MRNRFAIVVTLVVALGCSGIANVASAGAATPVGRSAPYEYLGWGSPPAPTAVMAASGITSFTLAFMLSKKACDPAWDGTRPLTGGSDQAAINSIRAAGGDVVVSFGGWSGKKLGQRCTTVAALTAAYQKVITTYSLQAIDIDIEHTEIKNRKARERVVAALVAIRNANPALEIYVTLGSAPSGPDKNGTALITYAKTLGFMPTAWTIMPFDFGGGATNMGQASVAALQALNATLRTTYGLSAAAAYQRSGISSMNGLTDDRETVTIADFQTIRAFAEQNHLARFTFWAVNRDRACATPGAVSSSCSGVTQTPYAYTKVIAQYLG